MEGVAYFVNQKLTVWQHCKKQTLYKHCNAAQQLILPIEIAARRVGAKLLPPNESHQPNAPPACNGPTSSLLLLNTDTDPILLH